jgi:hypothetical protein
MREGVSDLAAVATVGEGVPSEVTTDPSGSFQEWFVDRREREKTCNQSCKINLRFTVLHFSQVLLKTMVFAKQREREKWGLLWLSNVEW